MVDEAAEQATLGSFTSREPICPLDVPESIWLAVAQAYDTDEWDPAPNYHIEYRDCRNAYLATLVYLEQQV